MANIVDDSRQISINITGAYENFDLYPYFLNSALSRSGPVLTLTEMDRDAVSFIKKPVDALAFDLKMKMNLSRWDECTPASPSPGYCGGSVFMGPAFRNDTGNYFLPSTVDCLSLLFRTYGFYPATHLWRIRLRNSLFGWNTTYGTGPEMSWYNGQLNTDYYIRFWRTIDTGPVPSSVAYVGVYTDPGCTILASDVSPNPSTLTLMLADGVTPNTGAYSFFEAMGSYNTAAAGFLVTGTLSNYLLQV